MIRSLSSEFSDSEIANGSALKLALSATEPRGAGGDAALFPRP
jgi:hypothetical protein